MTRIVAARLWVCELCNTGRYEQKDILDHLAKDHHINPANIDQAADNLMQAETFTAERGCRPFGARVNG